MAGADVVQAGAVVRTNEENGDSEFFWAACCRLSQFRADSDFEQKSTITSVILLGVADYYVLLP